MCEGARVCKPTWAYLFACFFVIEFVLVCGCVDVSVCECVWLSMCLYICSFVFVLVFALMCVCTNLAETNQREDAGVASFFRKSTLKPYRFITLNFFICKIV